MPVATPQRSTAMAVLFVLIGAIVASAVWFAVTRSDDSHAEGSPTLNQLIAQLRQCASDGASHSITECDALAVDGLGVMNARATADSSGSGHRHRYAQTLAEHFARPHCSTNPTNVASLCRTDYLDLAVMVEQSRH